MNRRKIHVGFLAFAVLLLCNVAVACGRGAAEDQEARIRRYQDQVRQQQEEIQRLEEQVRQLEQAQDEPRGGGSAIGVVVAVVILAGLLIGWFAMTKGKKDKGREKDKPAELEGPQ